MRRLAILLICCASIFAGCSKSDSISNVAGKPNIVATVVAAGVAAGLHYFYDAFNIKKRRNRRNKTAVEEACLDCNKDKDNCECKEDAKLLN